MAAATGMSPQDDHATLPSGTRHDEAPPRTRGGSNFDSRTGNYPRSALNSFDRGSTRSVIEGAAVDVYCRNIHGASQNSVSFSTGVGGEEAFLLGVHKRPA